MTFPPGCVTRPLTAHAPFAEDGALLDAELVITASTALIWAANGQPLQPTFRSHDVDATSGLLMLPVPTTDQASGSWLNGSGEPIDSGPTEHSHTYSGSLTYTDQLTGQRVVRFVGPFVLPVEDGSPLPIERMTEWTGGTAGPIFVPNSSAAAEAAQAAAEAAEAAATTAAQDVADSLDASAAAAAASAAAAQADADYVVAHWPGPSGITPLVTNFSTSLTWLVPTGVNYGFAHIEVWGGGGAGGGGPAVNGSAGGGGGGYNSVTIPFPILQQMVNDPGTFTPGTLSIIVGAGGISGVTPDGSRSNVEIFQTGGRFSDLAFAGGGGGCGGAGNGGGGGGTGTGNPSGVADNSNGQNGSLGGLGGGSGGGSGVDVHGNGADPTNQSGGGAGSAQTVFGQPITRGGYGYFGGGGGGGGGAGSPISGPSGSDGGYGGASVFGGYGGGGGGGYASSHQGVGSSVLPSTVWPNGRYNGVPGVGGSAQANGDFSPGLPGGSPASGGGGASGGKTNGQPASGGAGGSGHCRITLY